MRNIIGNEAEFVAHFLVQERIRGFDMMLPEFLSQREKERFFHALNDEQKIDALNEIIEESKHIVFLGGAGVSTESGIPDFRSKDIPHCPKCGRMIRPDVTLYGEFLPQKAYEEAVALIRYADCLMIGGTSLEVGSAAQLAHMYHGKYLANINLLLNQHHGIKKMAYCFGINLDILEKKQFP